MKKRSRMVPCQEKLSLGVAQAFLAVPREPYSGSTKTARSDEHPESNYKKTVYPELNLGGGFTCEF
jgi:hypothetical protein